MTETSYSSWDPIRATRQNQDIQREVEDTAMFDIQVVNTCSYTCPVTNLHVSVQQGQLGSKRRGKPVKSTTIEVQTYTAGGSFLRLEQDWRESHMAYLQHKTCLTVRSNRPSSAGKYFLVFKVIFEF